MKRITREELYTQVWNTPMRTLAANYGLSDVGLGKICKKHTSSAQVYEPAIDLAAWKKWAHEQADRLDPLAPSPS